MRTVIEYTTCPSCECDRAEDLVPPGRSVDTTLDLIYSRNRAAEFSHVDLSAFLDPQFVICQNCALIFVRMRSTPAAAREYYGQLFHVIEAPLPFDTLPLPARFIVRRTKIAREMVATLVQNGVVNSKSTVLWARCNAGEGLKVLGDEHGLTELYGLEYLPSLIRHAKEVYGLENVEPLFTPEFENPFPREKYDVIFCNETFGHAHEPREIARYLKTLLSEGGVLVSYNEKDHLKILNDKKLFPYGMNFFHKQVFSRKSLTTFLELCGYEIEELPHPAIGKPSSLKNTKILYVARPSDTVAPSLPSDEVSELTRTFRRWWSTYRRYKRFQRVASFFTQSPLSPTGGGEARR